MKKDKFKKQIRLTAFGFLFVCFWGTACTENPFSEKTTISQNVISGRVVLENHSDPGNVFIWFKDLNVSTTTDSTGHFSLALPSPSQQPGGGIDGVYDLYFYAANYQLKIIKIAMSRGQIQPDDQTLTDKGELKETVVLTEILTITTSFTPKIISESMVDTIYATVTVVAKDKPVTISIDVSNPDFSGDPEFMTGFLLDSKKQFVQTLKRNDKSHRSTKFTVGTTSGSLKRLPILLQRGKLPPGRYYVMPYILIEQDLPTGLIEQIGANVTNYSKDFMKLPLKIHNNILKL